MTFRNKTAFWAGAALLLTALPVVGAAQTAQSANAGEYVIPVSASGTSSARAAEVPVPRRFVTNHKMTIAGKPLVYTATAGETYLFNRAGDPTGSIFSFSYVRQDVPSARRPVLFVFNGGPGSSSVWLHLGVIGPKRLFLDREVNPSNVPPFGLVDNPHTLLDVADLVFIDPVGTGWSRAIGVGKPGDFWGVNEDADAVSQFIELWLTENDRWNAPKYLLGESYGSARAALLPRALMGGPIYGGVMRGITVNGVILLGTTLEARETNGAPRAELKDALELPAIAATAWYHNRIDRQGRSVEDIHQEAFAFAIGDYAKAIELEKTGKLAPETRETIVARLVALTGAPRSAFDKTILLTARAYAKTALAADGQEIGIYDSRYTLPLANSGNDPVADDPAMGRYVPGFIAAFHQMASRDLKIRMERPYGAIVWKDLLPGWNWKRDPIPQDQSFARDLAVAMRRNPQLEVLVASGYYDFGTNASMAEYELKKAQPPADRVTFKRYESGHMLYLGDTAGQFSADIKALIAKTAR